MAQPASQRNSGPTRAELLVDAGALVSYLAARLALPVVDAPDDPPLPAAPRAAGVLLPLYARDGRPHLLFTRRAPTLRAHRGEISFPGGSQDATDATLAATALREADEELRIPPAGVTVLGQLRPVFTVVSNFLITPVVGWLGEGAVAVEPNPAEVAAVIEAPLAALADPAIFHIERWTRSGRQVPVYFYDLGPNRIWGATGRIVAEFFALLPNDDEQAASASAPA